MIETNHINVAIEASEKGFFPVVNAVFYINMKSQPTIYIYIYICVCVCVCVCKQDLALNSLKGLICHKNPPIIFTNHIHLV